MYEKASTFAATSRPKIAFRAIASLVVVMTLAACGVEDSAAGVTASGNQTSLDATLTKNELSFLLTLNASEQAGITELFSELKGWDFQPHQLVEALRNSVVAEEIGLSRRTSSGSRNLTTGETDELLDTFTTVNDPGYFLFLTDAGFAKWKIEDWGIPASRERSIMFAADPRSVRVADETRGGS